MIKPPSVYSVILFTVVITAYSPDNTAKTPPETDKESHYTVPFLTLRNKSGSENAADFFAGERDILRTGYCDISRTRFKTLKSIAENVPFYFPEDILDIETVRQSSSEDFWMDLDKTSNGQRPTLYTHGFYISFDRGCRRAAEFKRSLDLAGRFVLFSWPSDGVIINYTHDEADMYWSVDPLQETLSGMIKRYGAGYINIAAHSLGTRGIMLALVRIASAKHPAKDKNKVLINQLVLLAADIDAGIFKQYLPYIKPLVKNITIYVSEHDNPLALSKQVHGYPRLGESGTHLDGLDDIEIIDVSDVPVQYPSGHLYHLYNDEVVTDLYQLLNKNKPAAERSDLKQSGGNYWRLQPATVDSPGTKGKSADARQSESSQTTK